jgi:hypothetical protein
VNVNWDAVSAIGGAAGSLVSAGSLVVAAVTLRHEGRRWRQERVDAAAERREMERGLACLVTATTARATTDTATVRVTNDGQQPVFQIRVTTAHGKLQSRSDSGALADTIRRLDGGASVEMEYRTLPGEAEVTLPDIVFMDLFGRRWRRAGLGTPERVSLGAPDRASQES